MSELHWQRRWQPFEELHREVGRLFENLDSLQSQRQSFRYPPVNLYDAGEKYVLTVQLPGLSPTDIDLSITGETVTMRGERKRVEAAKDDNFRRQERPMGRWVRTITLPERVESTQVVASFSHGVLVVSCPKAAGAEPRQIMITPVAPAG